MKQASSLIMCGTKLSSSSDLRESGCCGGVGLSCIQKSQGVLELGAESIQAQSDLSQNAVNVNKIICD